MKIYCKLFSLFILIIVSDLNSQTNKIQLGQKIEILSLKNSPYSETLEKELSYLFVIDTNENYKYLYKTLNSIKYIAKDSVTSLSLNNGYSYKSSNYYHSFDNPISIYLMLLTDKATIEGLASKILKTDYKIQKSKSDSSEIIDIVESIKNIESHIIIEFDKKFKKFLFVTKFALLEGDTIRKHWVRYEFRPFNKSTIFDNIKEDIEISNEVIKEKRSVDNLKKRDLIKKFNSINYIDELENLDGTKKALTEIIGNNKYMVVYIWSSECEFCPFNFQNINKLYLEKSDFLPVVSINCEDSSISREQLAFYIRNNKIEFPTFQNCEFLEFNNIYNFDTIILLDSNFTVVDFYSGWVKNYSQLEDFLKRNNVIN